MRRRPQRVNKPAAVPIQRRQRRRLRSRSPHASARSRTAATRRRTVITGAHGAHRGAWALPAISDLLFVLQVADNEVEARRALARPPRQRAGAGGWGREVLRGDGVAQGFPKITSTSSKSNGMAPSVRISLKASTEAGRRCPRSAVRALQLGRRAHTPAQSATGSISSLLLGAAYALGKVPGHCLSTLVAVGMGPVRVRTFRALREILGRYGLRKLKGVASAWRFGLRCGQGGNGPSFRLPCHWSATLGDAKSRPDPTSRPAILSRIPWPFRVRQSRPRFVTQSTPGLR